MILSRLTGKRVHKPNQSRNQILNVHIGLILNGCHQDGRDSPNQGNQRLLPRLRVDHSHHLRRRLRLNRKKPKWDFIRQQRKTRQQESTAHERPPFETRVQREAREQRAEFMGDIHSEYMDRNRKLARNGLYTFRAGATLLGLLALCTGHPIIWLAFIGVWIYCGCAWFYYKHQAKKFSER